MALIWASDAWYWASSEVFCPGNSTSRTSCAAAATAEETVKLSDFIVTDDKDNGYRATNTIAATHINTELKNVPFNLQVITPEFIKDTLRQFENAHLNLMIFVAQCGARKHEDVMDSIYRTGTKVIPEFKERHGEHQKWRAQQLEGVEYPVNSSI